MAAEALIALPAGSVHACTDVTGFGLIGHATEMAAASGVTVTIEAGRVPAFDGILPLVRGNRSGGLESNRNHYGPAVDVAGEVDEDLVSLLFDPQTSGGLLVAAAASSADLVATALARAGVHTRTVGEVQPSRADRPGVRVVVRP